MPDAFTKPIHATLSPDLRELQGMLEREIPMCTQMGISVHDGGPKAS